MSPVSDAHRRRFRSCAPRPGRDRGPSAHSPPPARTCARDARSSCPIRDPIYSAIESARQTPSRERCAALGYRLYHPHVDPHCRPSWLSVEPLCTWLCHFPQHLCPAAPPPPPLLLPAHLACLGTWLVPGVPHACARNIQHGRSKMRESVQESATSSLVTSADLSACPHASICQDLSHARVSALSRAHSRQSESAYMPRPVEYDHHDSLYRISSRLLNQKRVGSVGSRSAFSYVKPCTAGCLAAKAFASAKVMMASCTS